MLFHNRYLQFYLKTTEQKIYYELKRIEKKLLTVSLHIEDRQFITDVFENRLGFLQSENYNIAETNGTLLIEII